MKRAAGILIAVYLAAEAAGLGTWMYRIELE